MEGVAAPVPVRSAVEDDFDAIVEIYAAEVVAGTASFELTPPDRAEMIRRWSTIVGRGLPYLVADLDGGIAGYAYAGPYRTRPAYRFTVEDSVYVAPWARRRGVGLVLLRGVVMACETAGARQMVAVIGDSAHVASIRLHEAVGFRLVGTLTNVGYKFERWLDTVIMQRPLGAGASVAAG